MINTYQKLMSLLRIVVGWVFLWAFLDKLFGLGFSTSPDKSWLAGTSPTFGFLKAATKGPLAGFYQNLAGTPIIDWLFMLGLLFIGGSLILGIFIRLASYAGFILVLLMYSALMFPSTNPVVDDHILYAVIFLIFSSSDVNEWLGRWCGLGNWWSGTSLVQKNPILK